MAATAVLTNWAFCPGEDKVYADSVLSAASTTQDVSGWAAGFTCHAYGDPTTVFFSTVGVLGSPATTGGISFTIASAVTAGLNAGQYEYVVVRNDAGNNVVLSRGLLTLLSR